MDRQAIECVIQNFFDASYAADPEKMAGVFHSEMQFFGFDREGGLVKKSKDSFVDGYRQNAKDPAWPDFPRVNEILSIDFTGDNTAVSRTRVRIRNTLFTDIFCFMRINGEWRIIAKVASGVPVAPE
jgi:uncharacterized protein (TIGR02246 family)